jgi:hypothetical protein
MIKDIQVSTIWNGRSAAMTWFHPRACMFPDDGQLKCLMTCQDITGSDVFGQVHWSISADDGHTWTDPEPIKALGRRDIPDGLQEGVCDVVPEYHPQTDTVLAIGHNVYYKDNVLTKPGNDRHPAYVIRTPDGQWSTDRKKLEWDDPRGTAMYTCGCAQRFTLANGDILIPLSFSPTGQEDRMVGSVLCSYDGEELKVLQSSNELRLPVNRGLLEPTIARFAGRFYMTIRAEDDRGYLTFSEDGLTWAEPTAWCWDDGEPLTLSTTQQRWLTHSNGLFLVYARRAEHNVNVMRWRSPLFVAQVDTARGCLLRDTEKTVFPLIGDGIDDPDHVARMGNFHVHNVSPAESWVTVGETLPKDGWAGDTLLGRIVWDQPNQVAPEVGDWK